MQTWSSFSLAAIFFWTRMIQTWSSFSLVDPARYFFCFSVKPKFFTPTHVCVTQLVATVMMCKHSDMCVTQLVATVMMCKHSDMCVTQLVATVMMCKFTDMCDSAGGHCDDV